MPKNTERTKRIRQLNDHFRASMCGGKILITQGIAELDPVSQRTVLEKVRLLEEFDKANDPYGEHDFGVVQHDGEKVYFKIDYYNKELNGGSEDAANPDITTRVMTVMFAHEY
jgi:hypothetical protein